MIRAAVGAACGALFVLAGLLLAQQLDGASRPALPPCAEEDSRSCYWDAETRGNGEGRSFTVDACGVLTFTDTGERVNPGPREEGCVTDLER